MYNPLGDSKDIYPRYTMQRGGKIQVEGEEVDKVIFTFLADKGISRVMFPIPFDSASKPLCKSDDGKVPSGGEEQQEGPCDQCPMAHGGQTKSGKPTASPCGATRSLLCYDHERGLVFLLPLRRQSQFMLSNLRNKLSAAIARVANKAAWGDAPALAVRFSYTVQVKKDGTKEFTLPVFAIHDTLPASDALMMFAIAESAGIAITSTEECLPVTAAEKADPPVRMAPVSSQEMTPGESDAALTAEIGAKAKTVIRRAKPVKPTAETGEEFQEAAAAENLPF